jgi:hypothetical protein
MFVGVPEKPGELKPLFDVHYGPMVGVDTLAPGNEYVVSVRQGGELQLWSMETSKLVSAIPICYEVGTGRVRVNSS